VVARREPHFLRRNYWKWFLFTAALSLVGPLAMTWQNPTGISVQDAFLLRRSYPGLGTVLVAYSMFFGIAFGGLIAGLLRWKS
jgi:uncharacterized membrane protein YhaH (DUF805 family)